MANKMQEWMAAYDDARMVCDQVAVTLRRADNLAKQSNEGGNDKGLEKLRQAASKQLASLHANHTQLESELEWLVQNPGMTGMTSKEHDKRQRMLDTLGLKHRDLSAHPLLSSLSRPQARRDLLEPGGAARRDVGGDGGQGGGRAHDDPDVLMQQAQLMQEQDDQLELLDDALGRIKNMSYSIHGELEEQDGLLNALEMDVDKTRVGLAGVQLKVRRVMRESSMGQLQCLLACLLVMLVLLIWLVL